MGYNRFMNDAELAYFTRRLQEMLDALDGQETLGQDGQKTVSLDQTAVGRLNRMDALQQQAMAKATQTRRDNVRTRIAAAQVRIKTDEFGYCTRCGEEIPHARLKLDPTAQTCVQC